ncbi:MAG: NAD(P)/FAD-dependent oxidoreductase [Alphaproteobacteria bacterium]|nr:NAD(P)/FAD-dependent oxidoreductase [Alphaproteobacteria bacterium]
MDRIECAVIGAGVVGLSVARALALAGREVVVLEAADAIGTGTSSRNSEVVHAGIYYPQDSLKARLCVEGRKALYRYCEARSIPHRRCGKLIVATDGEQVPALRALADKGRANGVDDLVWLSGEEAWAMEPALRCVAALHSPSTGIIDSHALMLSIEGEAESLGAVIAFRSPVRGAAVGGEIVLEVGGQETELSCRVVVNSAGLWAPDLARRFRGLDPALVPPAFLAKGNYFTLSGRAPFTRLIYPIPEPGGLGVHLTLDLGGQARFGPDVQWVEDIDYGVDPERGRGFAAEIRRYWPGIEDGALQPGYSGIRPKISGPGEAARDFMIQGPADHGVPGLVNLFGIESPGLTSCLALGEYVAGLVP